MKKNSAVLNSNAVEIMDTALALYKASNIDELIGLLSRKLTAYFNAECIRLFAYDGVGNEVYTRVKLSGTLDELKFPVTEKSVAGYTALHKQEVLLDDVRDQRALRSYPGLNYDASYEDRTGVRVQSIISLPLLENNSELVGVIQLVNTEKPVNIYADKLDILIHVGKLVAAAIFHHDERQKRAGKFDLLIEDGLISYEELTAAIRTARENSEDPIKGDPVSILMDIYGVPVASMQASISRYYLADFLPFDEARIIPPDIFKGFNCAYFRKNFVIPIAFEDNRLTILMDNPFNSALIRELKNLFLADHCKFFVGFRRDILKYIDSALGVNNCFTDGDESRTSDSNEIDRLPNDYNINIIREDAPLVVKIVNNLILEASRSNVSDIHIEPGLAGHETMVRFRKDGSCFRHSVITKAHTAAVINRIKIMAGLKLEEHRFPQSGKIHLKYGEISIELRVEVTPTMEGQEDVVMRILAGGTFLNIEELDLSQKNKNFLLEMISKPYGIILAVGPTGSGKTTTLHALLHHLNTPDKKIWTVEDPVEITQPGLRQVQVNLNIKPEPFDFAKAMRSFLRADPDIIMVGEMRDRETASIAVEASLTGHLVLSTLHTNSAPETVTRLVEMGLDPINVSDSLLGVLAQRLVRVLCNECKKEYEPGLHEIKTLNSASGSELKDRVTKLYRAAGCENCNSTGFKGRVGIHELLPATQAVKQAIIDRQPMSVIRERAFADGMRTLKMDGIRRVIKGQTTLEEVLKVCID